MDLAQQRIQSENVVMKRPLAVTAVALLLLSVAGCGGSNGRLHVDIAVTDIFESYTVLTDYSYFFHGPVNHPVAVMGIQKDYTLKASDLWHPVDLTPDKLRKWLNFPSPRVGYDHFRRGRRILGPDNSRIGIWYPVQDGNDIAFIKVQADNHLVIGAPVKTTKRRLRFLRYGPPEDD